MNLLLAVLILAGAVAVAILGALRVDLPRRAGRCARGGARPTPRIATRKPRLFRDAGSS